MIEQALQRFSTRDVSDPELPLAFAKFWRDLDTSLFTRIPPAEQICYQITLNHKNFTEITELLEKTIQLIAKDDHEHLTQYLSKRLMQRHTVAYSAYTADKDGYTLDAVKQYTLVNTLLYTLAATLDGMQTHEYHRLANLLYGELLALARQLLAYTTR